jgi:hypothetical protein
MVEYHAEEILLFLPRHFRNGQCRAPAVFEQNQDVELIRVPSRDSAAAQIIVIDGRGVRSTDKDASYMRYMDLKSLSRRTPIFTIDSMYILTISANNIEAGSWMCHGNRFSCQDHVAYSAWLHRSHRPATPGDHSQVYTKHISKINAMTLRFHTLISTRYATSRADILDSASVLWLHAGQQP